MTYRLVALSLATALGACAPASNPGLRPRPPAEAPAHADVLWEQTSFVGEGGLALFAQSWRPVAGAPVRGVVALHHGLADHSTRYSALAERLARAGYVVWGLDMRGHGRSAGPRVHMPSIDLMLGDLAAFLEVVRRRDPDRPLFLYGHSIGGLIVTLYAIERQPALAGLIVAAPGIAFEAPPIQAAVIQLVHRLNPRAPILETPHDDFAAEASVARELDRDPLVAQHKGPAMTARSAIDAVSRVWARPEALRVPLLVLHGDVDKLTAPSGSRDLVARAGSRDKMLRLYPGVHHDMFHDPKTPEITAELQAWLDAHTGGPALTFTSSPTDRPLKGDARGRAMALELDARAELPRGEALGGDPGVTAGLRARLGLGRGGAGVGYHGGVDLRGGVLDGGHYELDVHLAGLALRAESGATLAVTGGVGVGGVRGAGATDVPVELSLELPLGGARLLGRAGLAWRLSGDEYADDALAGVDEASALLGVRLGPDIKYWSSVRAGAGPFLAVTYRNLGGAELWGVALGAQLWGGN